jgi:hypothetical protein
MLVDLIRCRYLKFCREGERLDGKDVLILKGRELCVFGLRMIGERRTFELIVWTA